MGESYERVAEAAWRWVLDQVRWDDGPWIPGSVTPGETPEIPSDRDGMHSGIGGVAYLLAEIGLSRSWTGEEQALADATADRLRRQISQQDDCTFFDGLPSTVGVLTALQADGVEAAVARIADLAAPNGWPQAVLGPPRYLPGTRIHDATLGTAGVLLAALWAHRHGVETARPLAEHAADVLIREAEHHPTGSDWLMTPRRFRPDPESAPQMPNYSHGLAGVAAALACAGTTLDRPDLTAAAESGAEHLVTLADTSGHGFVVPGHIPILFGFEPITYNWCHGPTGTSLLFLALDRAGIQSVAGESTLSWHRRCLHSVETSGIPHRRYPGFWDNDGRCCGTAGVGEVFLDSWQRSGRHEDLEFAVTLADALVDRATHDGQYTYWRFVEHRAAEPLLPPGVGWMQGAVGIAAFLFRIDRLLRDDSDGLAVPRMDNWWALP